MADVEKKFRFRKFKVYQDARLFSFDLKNLTREKFPKFELFGLFDQLSRASDSVILNITEGCDRGTDKDFAHFLNNSHTSLNEVVACLDVALDNKYISDKEHQLYLERAADLADQLTAFRNNLLHHSTK